MAGAHTLAEQKGQTMVHLHPLMSLPTCTKCQASTPYGIKEITQTRF